MKKLILVCASLVLVSCTTGIGKKMSQATIDDIQAGKGKLTRDQVRKKVGAAPQTQLEREGMQCDSYAYSGIVNYFIFTKADQGQSYNFCYDAKTQILTKVEGIQM